MSAQTGIQAGSKQERYRRKHGQAAKYASPEELAKLLPKIPRLTPRQIRFLELVATGIDQRSAMKEAGYKSQASIQETLTNPLAQQYLLSIRSESRAIAVYDLAMAMEEARQDHAFAVAKGNAMAAVKATELRAKLSGLLIDTVRIEKVDLTRALEAAQNRVRDVTPAPIQLTDQPVSAEKEENKTSE